MIKNRIQVTRSEAEEFLLCEDTLWKYFAAGPVKDAEAWDRYLFTDREQIRYALELTFKNLRKGLKSGEAEFTVVVAECVFEFLWVVYRYVFDREHDGMPHAKGNVPLEVMHLPYYTMLWPLARKVCEASRLVVRVVY